MRNILLVALALIACIGARAQETASGQLKDFRNSTPPPRKSNLKDIPAKTLKVVLAGDNTLTDALLKESVENGWYLSPFEFISLDDFAKARTDTSSYFLVRAGRNAGWKEDSGMDFLSLRKGSADAGEDVSAMDEIMTLPLSPYDDTDGKVLPYIPSYISIIQKHIEKIMEKNLNAYLGMTMYNDLFSGDRYDAAWFREGDFAFDISPDKLSQDSGGKAWIATADQVEEILADPAPRTMVALVLHPSDPNLGSSNAYQMLICPESGELIYYHKHRITKNRAAGFSRLEYLTILKYFK